MSTTYLSLRKKVFVTLRTKPKERTKLFSKEFMRINEWLNCTNRLTVKIKASQPNSDIVFMRATRSVSMSLTNKSS